MKKIFALTLVSFLAVPLFTSAALVNWDRFSPGNIRPQFILDSIWGNVFHATSTTATSTFPIASTTTFCVGNDCTTTLPTPAGPTMAVQYRDGNSFAGSAKLLWDDINRFLIMGVEALQTRIMAPNATTPDTNGGSIVMRSGFGNGTGQNGYAALQDPVGNAYVVGGSTLGYPPFPGLVTMNGGFGAFFDTDLLTDHVTMLFPAGSSGTTDTFCFETLGNCGAGDNKWGDGGSYLYPLGNESVVIGSTTEFAQLPLFSVGVATPYLVVASSTGYLGLGTEAPTAGIQVANPINGTSPVAIFDTNTANQPFFIARNNTTGESLSMRTDDSSAYIESIQDEPSGSSGNLEFIIDTDGTTTSFFNFRGKNGTSYARILNSGNFGIGTTNPLNKFEVQGSTSGGINALIQNINGNANSSASLFLGTRATPGDTTVGTSLRSIRTDVGGAGSNDFTISTSLGTTLAEKVRVTAAGNVGIGTTTPTGKLTVHGIEDQVQLLVNASSTQTTNPFEVRNLSSANPIRMLLSNAGVLTLGSAVTTNTNQITPNVSVNGQARTMRFSNNTTVANEGFQFWDNNESESLMLIQQNGFVGIGTTTPTNTLTVAGNALIIGTTTSPCFSNNGVTCITGGGGGGDVTGPGSATDNALTRFDGATGKLIQNSSLIGSDAGDLTVPRGIRVGFAGTGDDDEIQVGDANFVLDYGSGSIPILLFDGSDGLSYARGTNEYDFLIAAAPVMKVANNSVSPGSVGGSSLGTTGLPWHNLFLNTGGAINMGNGNVVLTHTPNVLTLAGGVLNVSDTATSTFTGPVRASCFTTNGTNCITGAAAAGSEGAIQFNTSNALNGTNNLIYDATNRVIEMNADGYLDPFLSAEFGAPFSDLNDFTLSAFRHNSENGNDYSYINNHDWVWVKGDAINPALGTEIMRLTDTGLLGIGTDTPTEKLSILNDFDANPTFASRITQSTTATDTALFTLDLRALTSGVMGDGFGNVITFSSRDNSGFDNLQGVVGAVRDGNDAVGRIVLAPFAGPDPTPVSIRASGNTGSVNIGTTTGTAPLSIADPSPTANEIMVRVSTDVGDRFTVDEDGDTVMTGNVQGLIMQTSGIGTAAIPTYRFSADTNTGMYKDGSGDINRIGFTTNGTNVMVLDENQNVGIGTTSPWRKFSLNGTAAMNGLAAATAGTITLCINDTTKEIFQGSTNSSCTPSSIIYKKDVLNSDAGLSTLMQLRPVSFFFKEGDKQQQLGFIAEEVELIEPRLVQDDDKGKPHALRLDNFISLIVKAVQEIGTKNNAQDKRIQELESRLQALEEGKCLYK